MKHQISTKSLSKAVVFGLMMILIISSTGMVSATPAGRSASLLEDCTSAAGVALQPPYASGYAACALGNFTGLPSGIGAITFKRDDPNTLLVSTYSDTKPAAIYTVSVLRNAAHHITGLNTSGTLFATAPYADTGLAYGPGNVLFYSRWPQNEIGEIKPGSTSTDKVIDLAGLNFPRLVTGLNFVPAGFAHAGELKLVSDKTGEWFAADLAPDPDGTYAITSVTSKSETNAYTKTLTYVPPSSPQFADYSGVLVSDYYGDTINAYTLDLESNPDPMSGKPFLSGLTYVKGSTLDPLTNDLILTGPGTRVTAVRGFGTQPWVPTPTPTSTPTLTPMPTSSVPTYMISGHVRTSSGEPAAGVPLSINGVLRAYSNPQGEYYISGLPAGTYLLTSADTSTYWVAPKSYTFTVPPNVTYDFTAEKIPVKPTKPVIVLVHGWLGLPGFSDRCSMGAENGDSHNLFDQLPQWLKNDGYDVWVAHWDSGWDWTDTLEANGKCIADDIEQVKKETGANKVILLAHSMGGPVSRSYLQSDTYRSRNDVETFITFGSPHAGINGLDYVALIPEINKGLAAYCAFQRAFCEMMPEYMALFNNRNENNSIPYYFTGADGASGYFLGKILYPFNGPNDGLVSRASATGKSFTWFGTIPAVNHSVTRFRTHEDHLKDWGNWYFEPVVNDSLSASYKCIREVLLKTPTVDCVTEPEAPKAPPAGITAQAEETPSVLAPIISGHISTGETITRPLSVDTTGESSFSLTWKTGTLDLSLVDPNGLTIDPAYAMSNPSSVTFNSGPADNGTSGWMTYTFANSVPGAWTLKINAPDAGPDGTDWMAIASFESGRTLQLATDAAFYKIGDTATLTATLANGAAGIPGATVSVTLSRPDAITDTLTLTDIGGGQYRGTYTIPAAPGYMRALVTAQGSDGATAFSRETSQMLSIMPQTVQLTGTYADRAVDEDGDRFADALKLDVGVNVSQAGDYNLSGDLQVGDQIVGQFSEVFTAATGSRTMTLRFDGGDIYAVGLDGPYQLTHLVLVDLKTGVPTIMRSDLYTTQAYSVDQFKPMSPLFLPAIVR